MAAQKKAPADGTARGEHSDALDRQAQCSSCHGCASRLTWRDRRPLCRNCRAAERTASIHHLAPGRACPDCGAAVPAW